MPGGRLFAETLFAEAKKKEEGKGRPFTHFWMRPKHQQVCLVPVFFFAGISAEATSWGGFFAGGKKGRPFTVFRSAWHPDRAWGMPPWVHFSATQILRMLRQMCFKPTSHMRCQIVRRECCKAPLSTPGTAGDELPRVLQRERGDGGAAEKGASPGRGPAACRRCRRQQFLPAFNERKAIHH